MIPLFVFSKDSWIKKTGLTIKWCRLRIQEKNITGKSMASGTSKSTEIRLVNVVTASQEELLVDFQDYLRNNNFDLWSKDSKPAKAVRKLAYKSYETYRTYIEERSPGTVANIVICLTINYWY